LAAGSALVEGELVVDALEGADNELLAMTGEVDFDALTQSLEFSDSQAQPGEPVEVSHLISSGAAYFLYNSELAAPYPDGTEWVRITFDDPPPEEGSPDAQALMEPLVAVNLLRGAQSVEEIDSREDSHIAHRYRVMVDFKVATDESPAGISNRLALFDQLTYEKGLDKGLAPITVAIDNEGMIREVATAIPYYDSDTEAVSNYQIYTVRLDDFGSDVSVEDPPEAVVADWNPDLYIEGLTPPRLRSAELESAASTCENDFYVAGSLEAMAAEWGVEDPPLDEEALIVAIASKYAERYYGGSSEDPLDAPDLVRVTTEGCAQGIRRALRN
jgi:hypothetical protein